VNIFLPIDVDVIDVCCCLCLRNGNMACPDHSFCFGGAAAVDLCWQMSLVKSDVYVVD
jgi:hypothetical protein